MFRGDRSRKDHAGRVRLPAAVSALDNRPLKFEEFERKLRQTIFVSATPGEPTRRTHAGQVVEQVVRPTGLDRPRSSPCGRRRRRSTTCCGEIHDARRHQGERVLVTTLTKRMAEDLTDFLSEQRRVKVRYLHSDIDTVERVEIIRDLRLGVFDVLVGINLLREGLDIPEVSPGGDPRRRQGRLPALRPQPDPDDGPGRAQPQRHRDPLRRQASPTR